MRHIFTYLLSGICLLFSEAVYAQAINSGGKPIYIDPLPVLTEGEGDKKWRGLIGMGVGTAPTFIGSNQYETGVTLDLQLSWNDKLFLDNTRLGLVLYQKPFLRAGIIGRWNLGRRQDIMYVQNDGASDPDIWEAGAFVGTTLYKLFATAEIYYGLRGTGGSINAELEAGYTIEPTSKLRLTPVIGVNWGSGLFIDKVFSGNANMRALANFKPDSGIYEMFAEMNAEQQLGKNWLLKATLRASRLKDSAAFSSVVQSEFGSRQQFTGFLGLVRRF